MGDITDPTEQSPPVETNTVAVANGSASDARKRARPTDDDDDDDDDKPGRERRKISISFISDKSRRHITFSKRKAGIMKKAYELSVLTGTQVLLLVVSETGLVYTFTTPKLQPLVVKSAGKSLIQECLNAPEPSADQNNGAEPEDAGNSPENVGHTQVAPQPSMPRNGGLPPQYSLTPEQQQQMAYQQYMQQQQGVGGAYPIPPQ